MRRDQWPPWDGGKAGENARAAASLLSHRHRDDPPPPCASRPHLFEVPDYPQRTREILPRLLEAERLCLSCPLLPSCEAVADGLKGVVAGRLYGFRRVPDGTPPSALSYPLQRRKVK